jgi:hypothetical protein
MPKMSNTKAIEAILKMDREERKKGVREKEKKKKSKVFMVAGQPKDAPPMAKQRFIDRLKSKNPPGSKDISEIRSMKTLTSEGPGKLKLAKGGRAGYKMGGKCKLATKGKGRAYGKNS